MPNRIRFYSLWEGKEIIATIAGIALVLLFLGVLFFNEQIFNIYKFSSLDSDTIGQIESIKGDTIIRQTKLGSNPEVSTYRVDYTYEIDGIVYSNSDVIKGTSNNKLTLEKILNSSDQEVVVKYSSKDPTSSAIVLHGE